MSWVFRDFRMAVRSLLRARTFTAISVATLALGIGAAVAAFSVYDAILLNPLPYEDPDRLVMLWIDDPEHGVAEEGFGYPTYLDWRERNHVFEDVAASIRDVRLPVRAGEHFDYHYVNFTTPSFFAVLGVKPAHGRVFTQQEDDEGATVAVVSAGFAERFGGGEAALGAAFETQNRQYEIVGVMGEGFRFPHPETDVWAPWPTGGTFGDFRSIREADALRGIARLKPGVTAKEAERNLDAIGVALAEEHPPSSTSAGYDANVVPLLEQVTGADLPRLLRVLLAGVGLLFVIACVNLMNLVIVRSEARAAELGVRRALGASRWALARGKVAEASAIAVAGMALGLGLAWALVRGIVALAPAGIPRIEETQLDPAAFAFAAGLSALAIALSVLAPARAGRLVATARASTSSGESRRLQSAFVAGQAAIAVVLLCGTALFFKSFLAALALDPGYRRQGILFAETHYRGGAPDAAHAELLRRIRSYPGVEAAGGANTFEVEANPNKSVLIEGQAEPKQFPLTGDGVTTGYFEALGVPLLRGRLFEESDFGKSVAVINETMARQFWGPEDPLGSSFHVLNQRGERLKTWRVVGLVGDMRRQGIEREPIAQMFPLMYVSAMKVAVRTSGDRGALGDWIREQYAEISPSSVPVKLQTIEQTLDKDLAPRRFYTAILVGAATLALTLTAVGLFGLMAYVVERRTREIGVRMAVGARPADILAQVLGEGARLVIAGCALGLLGVLWMGDLLGELLFQTSGRDAAALLSAASALLLTGLLACFIPARRAAAADPTVALRSE